MHPHSGTLASNCVRHIDSTELLCKTPSNICSEMLRELRRKPEILIFILQVLHSKLLHGSRTALRFRPRVPKASILNDDQGIFVLSFWLFLRFISVCGFSQQKHGCPLTFKEHPFGKRKKKICEFTAAKLKVHNGYKEQELLSRRTIPYLLGKSCFIVI